MKNLTKRLLSIVLAVVMVVALLPANILSVFAVAPESISLYAPLYQYDKDEGTGKLSVGQQITAKAKDADGKFIDAQNITFTTSDPTVVTVDASGVMTGVHSGTATVTAAHKEDEAVNASLTVTVTNVSTYVLGLEAFNVGIVNSDGTLDYGQNLAGNYGFSATYSPAYWTDHDATNFIPFQLSSTTGEHSYATGKDYVISRVGVGWYLRATDYTNTVKIANMAYSNTTYSAPWAFGRGFETGVSNRGWETEHPADRVSMYPPLTSVLA